MPLFYCDRGAKQSADHGSPKVTKNLPLAGFEVIIYGRFWVITEDEFSKDVHLHLGVAADHITAQQHLTCPFTWRLACSGCRVFDGFSFDGGKLGAQVE